MSDSSARPRRTLRGVLAGLLAYGLLLTAGCSGDPEPTSAGGAPPRDGGTLHVLVESEDFAHLDPQRVRDVAATNVTRLFARTLTTYRPAPGSRGSELVPDLATDLGRPSEKNTVWEFTLKRGLRWQDGSTVTCEDVKHGVERSFSSLIDGGPTIYTRTYLAGAEEYQGPYLAGNDGGEGLRSVRCQDKRTVEFRLSRPVGDFSYVVALPVFAPTPLAKDTRESYDRKPFSNGPYQVAEYGKDADGELRLTLTRNRHWNPKTDLARQQHPERIVVRFGQDADQATYRLIADEGDYRYAVALDMKVSPRFVQQVINDPKLSARTLTGTTSGVRYLAINSRSVPDLACRQALTYGFDRHAFRGVLGGSPYGDYATSILPPTMKAHRKFDLYGVHDKPAGDLRRARMLMSGEGCPEQLVLDYLDAPPQAQASDVIVAAYQRIGIRVKKNPIDAEDFLDVVTTPSKQHDLVLATWVPDFPNGSGTIPALFDGRTIREKVSGNFNFSLVDDKEINQLIDRANAESDLARQYRLWGELDRKIQEKALVVPIVYDRSLQLLGSKVRGSFLHPAYLGADLASLGVA